MISEANCFVICTYSYDERFQTGFPSQRITRRRNYIIYVGEATSTVLQPLSRWAPGSADCGVRSSPQSASHLPPLRFSGLQSASRCPPSVLICSPYPAAVHRPPSARRPTSTRLRRRRCCRRVRFAGPSHAGRDWGRRERRTRFHGNGAAPFHFSVA